MQPPTSDMCVLCGIRKAETRDHVPPRCFFTQLSSQLITVPACSQCNNGSSSDDEDMRFFLSLQVGKRAPGATQLWENRALKSINRKSSLKRQVVNSARDVVVKCREGNEVTRLAVEIPVRLYDSVFGRITKGLYFNHTGMILKIGAEIQVSPLVTPPVPLIPRQYRKEVVANGQCVYWFCIASDEPSSSSWIFCFYDHHWVMVSTGAVCEL